MISYNASAAFADENKRLNTHCLPKNISIVESKRAQRVIELCRNIHYGELISYSQGRSMFSHRQEGLSSLWNLESLNFEPWNLKFESLNLESLNLELSTLQVPCTNQFIFNCTQMSISMAKNDEDLWAMVPCHAYRDNSELTQNASNCRLWAATAIPKPSTRTHKVIRLSYRIRRHFCSGLVNHISPIPDSLCSVS